MAVQKMTRIALLAAILYVSKAVLEFLPNVELVSLLVILYTIAFGAEALVIVTVFNGFELLQWGFGTWWVTYLYAWPLLCLIVLALRKVLKEDFTLWAVVSGGFGLIFGSLFAIAYIPISPSYALNYWIAGLLWDVWHAVCNFVLMLVLGKPVYRVLKMLKQKTER